MEGILSPVPPNQNAAAHRRVVRPLLLNTVLEALTKPDILINPLKITLTLGEWCDSWTDLRYREEAIPWLESKN